MWHFCLLCWPQWIRQSWRGNPAPLSPLPAGDVHAASVKNEWSLTAPMQMTRWRFSERLFCLPFSFLILCSLVFKQEASVGGGVCLAPLRSRWVAGLGNRRRCEPFGTIAAICPNNLPPDGGRGLPPGRVLHRPSQMGRQTLCHDVRATVAWRRLPFGEPVDNSAILLRRWLQQSCSSSTYTEKVIDFRVTFALCRACSGGVTSHRVLVIHLVHQCVLANEQQVQRSEVMLRINSFVLIYWPFSNFLWEIRRQRHCIKCSFVLQSIGKMC